MNLPDSSVRCGEFVAEHITPLDGNETLPEEAIQPNGVDLSIGQLFELSGKSYIGNDNYDKADRIPVSDHGGYYNVNPDNSYIVVYGEKIAIPENHIGLVFPRSRLMRCGLNVETAVWDAGYEGNGEGGLTVNNPAKLDPDLRVAQIVFIQTEELNQSYSGSHQGERIEN